MVKKRLFTFLVTVVLLSGVAYAQTTGTLTGTVTTAGAPLPGATVIVTSPALIGSRTTVTGATGDYNFPSLPPGKYTVVIELEGMQKITRTADVRLSDTARADADLKVSAVAESITVTAAAPSVLETPTVSTSLTREMVESLPIGRTIAQRIQLAPGVNNQGPNAQTVINGAPSYDNLYLINGVVVNDTIRGQPENLFIEDAIQETTLLTGGVSAEYGRFTGGVVNTITKSGGNEFTGSFRDSLTNPSWTDESEFEDPVTGARQPENQSKLLHQYEATLGGYVLRDRLWFFGAGRKFDQSIDRTTTATNIPFVNQLNNERYEGKLTGQITPKHTLIGSYIHNETKETNNRFGNVVDLRSLSDRTLPNWLQDYHYQGVITNNLLVEAMYSRRYFAFVGGGGPQDLINGTLMRDNTTARRMWSPTFCGTCDNKTRNNKDYLLKGSYFLSSPSFGSHNIILGYDDFHELRNENNYQSGSNYRIWGDFVYDGQNVYFHTDPAAGFLTINPISQLSKTSDVQTQSVFVNDKWDLNNHFSFNVGLRYDRDNGRDQAKNTVAEDSAFSPRLGVIYDLAGNGRDRISASYARYLSHIDGGIVDTLSPAGVPGSIYFNYRGPEINAFDPATGRLLGPPVPTDEVIRRVFEWFESVGGVTGYKDIDSISVPGLTAQLGPDGLVPPKMDEFALGYGRQIGAAGYVRADFIHRDWKDFYTLFINQTTPKATLANGNPADVALLGNVTDQFERTYDGIQLQGAYRLGRYSIGGNYTYSETEGNIESETFNNATVFAGSPGSTATQYPEYYAFERNNPVGPLNEDIRHRGTVYANADFSPGWGTISLGLLERYHSGAPYSAVGLIDSRNAAAFGIPAEVAASYATPPSSVNYYFSDRGEFRLPSVFATDLTAQYNLPTFGKLGLFFRADLVNAFNQDNPEYALTNLGAVIETRIYTIRQRARSTDNAVAFSRFNPFTTTPVEYKPGVSDPNAGPYHYQYDRNFGKPINFEAYGSTALNPNQLPRTYRFAVGLRF